MNFPSFLLFLYCYILLFLLHYILYMAWLAWLGKGKAYKKGKHIFCLNVLFFQDLSVRVKNSLVLYNCIYLTDILFNYLYYWYWIVTNCQNTHVLLDPIFVFVLYMNSILSLVSIIWNRFWIGRGPMVGEGYQSHFQFSQQTLPNLLF